MKIRLDQETATFEIYSDAGHLIQKDIKTLTVGKDWEKDWWRAEIVSKALDEYQER